MTRTAALIRGELEAVRRRCAELEAAWAANRTEVPPAELSTLYLRRDVLTDELAQVGTARKAGVRSEATMLVRWRRGRRLPSSTDLARRGGQGWKETAALARRKHEARSRASLFDTLT